MSQSLGKSEARLISDELGPGCGLNEWTGAPIIDYTVLAGLIRKS